MEFSIAALLANFTNDKLVAVKVLEKKLNCLDEIAQAKLHIALEVLEKIGVLVKERGKYRRLPEEGVIEAKLRCSSKGFCFAIQDVEGAEDIYIRESHLSNAWNGDRVLVKLTKEGSRRRSPEGEVRLILERANHSLLGRIKQTNTGFRAIPLDDRLLFEIEVKPDEHNLAEAINHLVHVEILRYALGQSPPAGRVVQILGSDAEAASDVDLVCCKHDLPRHFSAAVLEAAAALPNQIRKTELKKRLDLRSLLTLTFQTGVETNLYSFVENAFTLEKNADEWRLGIHITDVAYYVQLDSPLDREAIKRGSCVYLGERVLPLLPDTVIQRCSLSSDEHLALSVLVTVNLNTRQLVEFEIQPTAISVNQQLSEEQAQLILNGQQVDASHEVIEMLNDLSALGEVVKELDSSRGSFELKLPQRQTPYYDEGVLGAVVEAATPVQSLFTQLIVLANQLVATHLQALGIPAVYRVQPAPDLEETQEMIKLASNLGVELRLEQEDAVQPSDFKHFTQQFAFSPDSEQVLTYLLRDTLKSAVHSTTPQLHFGLALQSYTHCSFPLRRYPDLLLQRILHTLFEQGRDRRTTRAKEHVNLRHSSAHGNITWNVLPPEIQQELETELANTIIQINDREKEVQEAEDDLAGLQKAQLMKQRTGEVFQGLVTGVQSYGFFVEIEVPAANNKLLRVEGLVHVSSLKDDWYEYRARQQALFGRKNRAAYRLGDRVAVQVKSVDYYRQQIDLVTVNGGAEGATVQADQQTEPEEMMSSSTEDETLNFEENESYRDEE